MIVLFTSALLTFTLFIRRKLAAARRTIFRKFFFHLATLTHGPVRKVSTNHVRSTLYTMRLIARIVLTSVIAIPLTIGSSASGTFQVIMPVDDENAESGLTALLTHHHLSRDHLLVIANGLNIDEFHCGRRVEDLLKEVKDYFPHTHHNHR